MADEILYKDNTNAEKKKNKLYYSDFAKEMGHPVELINRIDDLTTSVKNDLKDLLSSTNGNNLVGNVDRKYCGKSFNDNSVWIGAFFEKKVELRVGFWISDDINEVSNGYLPKLLNSNLPFSAEYAKIDDGYWIYIKVDSLLSNDSEKEQAKVQIEKIFHKVFEKKVKNIENNEFANSWKWPFVLLSVLIGLLIFFIIGFDFSFTSDFRESSDIQKDIPSEYQNQDSFNNSYNCEIISDKTKKTFNKPHHIKIIMTNNDSKWAICIVLSVSIICLTVICIISMIVYKKCCKTCNKMQELSAIREKIDSFENDVFDYETEKKTTSNNGNTVKEEITKHKNLKSNLYKSLIETLGEI